MKKILPFALTMLLCAGVSLARAQDIGFKVQFSGIDATCYNNGKVVYALLNEDGSVWDSLPSIFSNVRVYYKVSPTDSAHYAGWYYTGGYDTLTLNFGTYIVGVEALLSNVSGDYVKMDTQIVITLGTSYQKPDAAVVIGQGLSESRGTLGTISCLNAGRVQLEILNGKYPYKVTVLDHESGDTLRIDLFHSRQYNGTFRGQYDYKDYYSIDSLPGGIWDFYVEDGCGYGLPRLEQQVQVYNAPIPTFFHVAASSGNFADSNVVKHKLTYFNTYGGMFEILHRNGKYRYTFDTLSPGEWKRFPKIDDPSSLTIVLYDTVEAAGKFCDIWNREIKFEYLIENCGDGYYSKTFRIEKPNDRFFLKDSVSLVDSVVKISNCASKIYWHRDGYTIKYYCDSCNNTYLPDLTTIDRDDIFHRYHYTHPIFWEYTDRESGEVIKIDTIKRIVDESGLYYQDIERVYGPSTESVRRFWVERRLLDAKNCVLYSTVDSLVFERCISSQGDFWMVDYKQEKDYCCSKPRQVILSTSTPPDKKYDYVHVRLIHSPLNNLYNFEANYDPVAKNWTIVKSNMENDALIVGSPSGAKIYISNNCLPSGPYLFEVTSACSTDTIGTNVAFYDYYDSRVLQEPRYTISRDCSNMSVTYYQGRYERRLVNTSPETGLPVDTIVKNPLMEFSIFSGPASSSSLMLFELPARLVFTQPGRYVIRMKPHGEIYSCEEDLIIYDTVDYEMNTVEFVRAVALLCDSSSTIGNVLVEGIHGFKPYTYTLYDQPEKEGNVLGVNGTGVFQDIPMRSNQILSCMVQDSCGAYFHINIIPHTLAELQKLWFNDNLTTATACEGSTIQAHALAIGSVLQYEWSGPNGFHSTSANPEVFVSRGNSSGWYKVTLWHSGCNEFVTDSIYLTVLESPDITLSPDTTVCPGEPVVIRFMPVSPAGADSIQFTVAFVNANGTETRHYSAVGGETVVDTFVTLSPAKIFPLFIKDSQCSYLYSDSSDTIHIHLRTDLLRGCDIWTTLDTVCSGGDAQLTAKANIEGPYALRWYGDYAMTQLLKTDSLSDNLQWSSYDTAGITQRTLLYASVSKEGFCPSVNGVVSGSMTMAEGETQLACGESFRIYDSGGSEASSAVGERIVHRFIGIDGSRVSFHFDYLNLDENAQLLLFTGNELNSDSLLCILNSQNRGPVTMVSFSNILTLYHIGGMTGKSDWSAIVETAPGIAVAEVSNTKFRRLRDEVCQSRTKTYEDPYGISPVVATTDELNHALRSAGDHYFYKIIPTADIFGCDSAIHFTLSVKSPVTQEIRATVTSQQGGFLWMDSLYVESGQYAALTTLPDGCDMLNLLHLTVVNVECSDTSICLGDSAILSASVSLSEPAYVDSLVPVKARPGDVLCDDGSLLPVGTFLASGKTPKGVVFHVDETGLHGLAIALQESVRIFTREPVNLFFSNLFNYVSEANRDLDGENNTLALIGLSEALNRSDYLADITAAGYCYYYDHRSLSTDISPRGWYLPSLGELNLLWSEIISVNQTLDQLLGLNGAYANVSDAFYWSSTLKNALFIWTSGAYNNIGNYGNSYKVRPITKF